MLICVDRYIYIYHIQIISNIVSRPRFAFGTGGGSRLKPCVLQQREGRGRRPGGWPGQGRPRMRIRARARRQDSRPLLFSPTAESFGVSAQIGSGPGQGSTRVPPAFHQRSTRFPAGFHEVLSLFSFSFFFRGGIP